MERMSKLNTTVWRAENQNTHFIKYEYYKSMLSIKIGLIKAQTCATIESNPSTAMKAATLSDEKPIICTKKTHKQFFI